MQQRKLIFIHRKCENKASQSQEDIITKSLSKQQLHIHLQNLIEK
jgi:tRNA isopentenyl-2-thiomethyl-A-37 hydroxylase MiaE